MSDYLSNLANRSRGGVGTQRDSGPGVIQPRLASLFEPLHVAGQRLAGLRGGLEGSPASSTFDEASSDETFTDARRPTQPLASLSAAHPLDEQSSPADWPHRADLLHRRFQDSRAQLGWRASHRTAQPSSPMPVDLQRVESMLEQPLAQPSPDLPAPVQPSAVKAPPQPGQDLPSLLSSVSQNKPVPPGHTAAQPRQSTLEPGTQRIVIERVGSSKELSPDAAKAESGAALPGHSVQPIRPALEPAIRHVVIERDAALEEQQPLVIPRPELSSRTTTRSSPLAPIIAQPRVTAYSKPAASAPPQPAAAPQPAPTVHVTIGRIEVRATSPSVPPQGRRAAPPVMSLDEYLNRRTQGGDR